MRIELLGLAGILVLTSQLACADKDIPDDTTDGGADGGGADGGADGGGGDGGGDAGDDCGGDIASACELEIDETKGFAQMAEVLDPAGDRDFFKISMGAGEILAVGTLAYRFTGSAEPDTVLRLYNSAGTLLATNDDMPFRIQETDSALYYQAKVDEDVYLEVLEWSDWDPGYDPAGGPTFEYEIVAFNGSVLDPEPDNNTVEGIVDWVETQKSVPYYGTFWHDDAYPWEFWGMIDEVGDVDIFPSITFKEDVVCAYTVWPTYLHDLEPSFTLHDAEGNELAYQPDPIYSLDRSNYFAGMAPHSGDGLVFSMKAETEYYLTVADQGGASGVGTFYPGVLRCFTWNTDVVTVETSDTDNNTVLAAQALSMTESTSGGLWYGFMSGEIDTTDILPDERDSYRITTGDTGGSLDGKLLSVVLQAESVGGKLDAAITVYGSDATTVLATATTNDFDSGADPAIIDLVLSGVTSSIYVVVEAEDASMIAGANQYTASVYVAE